MKNKTWTNVEGSVKAVIKPAIAKTLVARPVFTVNATIRFIIVSELFSPERVVYNRYTSTMAMIVSVAAVTALITRIMV